MIRRTQIFFNDTATTEIYTHSLHDARPSCTASSSGRTAGSSRSGTPLPSTATGTDALVSARRSAVTCAPDRATRSEEHTSELQSRQYLVCRLLPEKKRMHPSASQHSVSPRV